MPEIDEKIKEALEKAEEGSRLNSAVAILVAIVATLMALGKIKDENIIITMEHAQSKVVDSWSFYQAKSLKEHIMEFGGEQVRLHLEADSSMTSSGRESYTASAARYDKEVKRYGAEREEIRKQAEHYQHEYDVLKGHHDQLSISEALYSIAIATAGITALTRKKWLFGVALILAGLGLVYSLAGFLGWSLHAEWLVKLLGS